MRLSYTKTLFLHSFLIISLTLLLNPTANAQQISFANAFTFNNMHNRYSINEPESDPVYVGPTENNRDVNPVDKPELSVSNFYHKSENLYLKPRIHNLNNSSQVYPAHSIIPARIYSIELKHSVRFTFKLFKLMILPLWQSK